MIIILITFGDVKESLDIKNWLDEWSEGYLSREWYVDVESRVVGRFNGHFVNIILKSSTAGWMIDLMEYVEDDCLYRTYRWSARWAFT